MRLYRIAAEQGDYIGQLRLGGMFEHGQGVAQDIAEAIRWYRLAAAQGDADAQERLVALESESRKRARPGAQLSRSPPFP
jgi:hypothetical protein